MRPDAECNVLTDREGRFATPAILPPDGSRARRCALPPDDVLHHTGDEGRFDVWAPRTESVHVMVRAQVSSGLFDSAGRTVAFGTREVEFRRTLQLVLRRSALARKRAPSPASAPLAMLCPR